MSVHEWKPAHFPAALPRMGLLMRNADRRPPARLARHQSFMVVHRRMPADQRLAGGAPLTLRRNDVDTAKCGFVSIASLTSHARTPLPAPSSHRATPGHTGQPVARPARPHDRSYRPAQRGRLSATPRPSLRRRCSVTTTTCRRCCGFLEQIARFTSPLGYLCSAAVNRLVNR